MLNLGQGGGKCYRIHVWLYGHWYVSAGCKEVMSLSQGLDSIGQGGGICYRIHLWLYGHWYTSAGCREVMSLSQGLDSRWSRPREQRCPGFE